MSQENGRDQNSNELALQFGGESLRRIERLRRKIGTPNDPADYDEVVGAAFELLERVDDKSMEGKVVIVARQGDGLRLASIPATVLAKAKEIVQSEDWKE